MVTDIEMSFRHLRGITMSDLSSVNIIVGPNNAGKTSIFRGIRKLTTALKNAEEVDYIILGTRIDFPEDVWSSIMSSPGLSSRFSRSDENGGRERRSPTLWGRHGGKGISAAGKSYISHGNTSGAEVFRFADDRCYMSRIEGAGHESSISGVLPTKLVRGVLDPIAQKQATWRSHSYFLWHRRKSRYEENLGAHHARLDEEAEHLAGRLDQMLSETRGGATRHRINTFMNAVVPGIGEVGIRRRVSTEDKATIISVVFLDAQGERSLGDLGGGVEQILALALVLIGETDEGAVFLEEPESHLHESAQRRLIEQIIQNRGTRQLFIATHSPVFVNEFPGANVYRVTRDSSGAAMVHPCVDKASQREVLNELGVLPSSLTQTNCVIWVEGPTETRLVRRWLEMVAPELKVHQQYEFAQTGGSNLVSLAADVPVGDTRGLRDIMRVCRRNFIICDRDAGTDTSAPKAAVQAVESLVGSHHWITRGYEIEWYVPRAIIDSVWDDKVGDHMAGCVTQNEPFYDRLATSGGKTRSAGNEKVKWAERFTSAKYGPEVWFEGEMGDELRSHVERLARFIRDANQIVAPTSTACASCGQKKPPL